MIILEKLFLHQRAADLTDPKEWTVPQSISSLLVNFKIKTSSTHNRPIPSRVHFELHFKIYHSLTTKL